MNEPELEVYVRSSADIIRSLIENAGRQGRSERTRLRIQEALSRAAIRDITAKQDITSPPETVIIRGYSTFKIT